MSQPHRYHLRSRGHAQHQGVLPGTLDTPSLDTMPSMAITEGRSTSPVSGSYGSAYAEVNAILDGSVTSSTASAVLSPAASPLSGPATGVIPPSRECTPTGLSSVFNSLSIDDVEHKASVEEITDEETSPNPFSEYHGVVGADHPGPWIEVHYGKKKSKSPRIVDDRSLNVHESSQPAFSKTQREAMNAAAAGLTAAERERYQARADSMHYAREGQERSTTPEVGPSKRQGKTVDP